MFSFLPLLTLVSLALASPYRGFFESDCTSSCRVRENTCLDECPVRRNEVCLARCPFRDDEACNDYCPPERDEYCAKTCAVKYVDNCSKNCQQEPRHQFGMTGLVIQVPFNFTLPEQNSCARNCPLRQDRECVRECRYRDDCSQRCPYEPEPECVVECTSRRSNDCSSCRDSGCRSSCGRRRCRGRC